MEYTGHEGAGRTRHVGGFERALARSLGMEGQSAFSVIFVCLR
jgi:hypothetical protein